MFQNFFKFKVVYVVLLAHNKKVIKDSVNGDFFQNMHACLLTKKACFGRAMHQDDMPALVRLL